MQWIHTNWRDPLEIQGDSESGVDDDELGTTENKPNYLSYHLLRVLESLFLGSASGLFSELLIDLAPD